jgi:hypothetical protein
MRPALKRRLAALVVAAACTATLAAALQAGGAGAKPNVCDLEPDLLSCRKQTTTTLNSPSRW